MLRDIVLRHALCQAGLQLLEHELIFAQLPALPFQLILLAANQLLLIAQ